MCQHVAETATTGSWMAMYQVGWTMRTDLIWMPNSLALSVGQMCQGCNKAMEEAAGMYWYLQ